MIAVQDKRMVTGASEGEGVTDGGSSWPAHLMAFFLSWGSEET